MTVELVVLICALVTFLVHAANVPARINLQSLAFAFLVLWLIVRFTPVK